MEVGRHSWGYFTRWVDQLGKNSTDQGEVLGIANRAMRSLWACRRFLENGDLARNPSTLLEIHQKIWDHADPAWGNASPGRPVACVNRASGGSPARSAADHGGRSGRVWMPHSTEPFCATRPARPAPAGCRSGCAARAAPGWRDLIQSSGTSGQGCATTTRESR